MIEDEISDVDSKDELGAPKAVWLMNIEREEKKKRRRMQTEQTVPNSDVNKIGEKTPIIVNEAESMQINQQEYISVPIKGKTSISEHRGYSMPTSV